LGQAVEVVAVQPVERLGATDDERLQDGEVALDEVQAAAPAGTSFGHAAVCGARRRRVVTTQGRVEDRAGSPSGRLGRVIPASKMRTACSQADRVRCRCA